MIHDTTRRSVIIYLSGKYSGDTLRNIAFARSYASSLWDMGFTVLCPHMNGALLEKYTEHCDYDDFLTGCLYLLNKCDAAFFMPEWEDSIGAGVEREFCIMENIPCFEDIDALDFAFPMVDIDEKN